jgi:hypothetical protein
MVRDLLLFPVQMISDHIADFISKAAGGGFQLLSHGVIWQRRSDVVNQSVQALVNGLW